MNRYKERLLNVVKALRESRNPGKFTMEKYGRFCGTPACAIGHYAARRDLQNAFRLSFWHGELCTAAGTGVSYNHRLVQAHFGITYADMDELFNETGCGAAQTANEAADYIEAFIERKWPTVTEPAARKFIQSIKESA